MIVSKNLEFLVSYNNKQIEFVELTNYGREKNLSFETNTMDYATYVANLDLEKEELHTLIV